MSLKMHEPKERSVFISTSELRFSFSFSVLSSTPCWLYTRGQNLNIFSRQTTIETEGAWKRPEGFPGSFVLLLGCLHLIIACYHAWVEPETLRSLFTSSFPASPFVSLPELFPFTFCFAWGADNSSICYVFLMFALRLSRSSFRWNKNASSLKSLSSHFSTFQGSCHAV